MSLEFTVWNMENGFVDGLVRGWRSTFLKDVEYSNLKEGGRAVGGGESKTKEDFEDMRLALQETDYGNFLASEASLDPKLIGLRATEKWVKEFKYFRTTATGKLGEFMDYVSYEYMIDNILDLIKAATSSQTVDVEALVESCHPLGMLAPSIMKSILAYDDLGEGFRELYRTVLVETPVGKYFTQFLQGIAAEKAAGDLEHARTTFTELPMTIIENTIKKLYLEDFYYFCLDVGGETAEIMGDILRTRADVLTINITLNSLHNDYGRGHMKSGRAALYPAFGYLYPEGTAALENVEDEEGIGRVLQEAYPAYATLWTSAASDAAGNRDISQVFFQKTVKQLELAFEGQFHFGPFYAYVKLKEQEVKNIVWIATCMEHGAYAEMDRIIPIFSKAIRSAAM